MKIIVNGKAGDFNHKELSIADVLKLNNVIKPEMVSVQLNEKFVDQDQFASVIVKENDEIDFIYFMGGGCN